MEWVWGRRLLGPGDLEAGFFPIRQKHNEISGKVVLFFMFMATAPVHTNQCYVNVDASLLPRLSVTRLGVLLGGWAEEVQDVWV